MMATGSFTTSELETLSAAIATGATEVRYADRTVRYNSLQQMLELRDRMVRELAQQNPATRKRRHYAQYRRP